MVKGWILFYEMSKKETKRDELSSKRNEVKFLG